MSGTIVVNSGSRVIPVEHPEVVLITEEEPAASGVCYAIRGDRVLTCGYQSGLNVEFVVHPGAMSLLRSGAPLWVGNIGGSERAVVAEKLNALGVFQGVFLSIVSNLRRMLERM